jgi:hypothetical protein
MTEICRGLSKQEANGDSNLKLLRMKGGIKSRVAVRGGDMAKKLEMALEIRK